MGNSNTNLTEAQFKEHWKQVDLINGLAVWENKDNPRQRVDQYILRDEQIQNNQKLNLIRRNNSFLVNAQTLKKEGFSCQMDQDTEKLYVQRTPLRLSNLKDIPYPDIFHLYDVCLHGYELLTKLVGYFSIDEDQIGITEGGQAKVWLSNHFQSNKINGVSITQSKMVSDILNMLYQVADNDSCGRYQKIDTYVRNHQKITFAQAISKFVQYVRTYCGGEVPTRLSCVNQVGHAKIEHWCRTNQAYNQVSMLPDQYNRNQTIGDVANRINKLSPGVAYANRISSQPVLVSNNTPNPTQSSRTNFQSITQPVGNTNSVIETRVGQANPAHNLIVSGIHPNAVTYPINNLTTFPQAQIINPISAIRNPPVGFKSQPSSNLVGVNYRTQNINPFTPRPAIKNSQVKIVSSPFTFIPSTQGAEQLPPRNIQRPLINQNKSFMTQATIAVRTQVPSQSFQQTYNNRLTNPPSGGSQSPIAIYNQPLQVVESIALNQLRDENRLQQQRVLSQTIELKDGGKTVQTTNLPVVNNQKNVLKGSETIQWQDYTNKQKSSTKELNNQGRAIPYSFDGANDTKTENLYENKLTPQNDGKSSPQFLALLSQIKSGIGKTTNGQSDNYSSFSILKGETSQGRYGTYEESNKFTSTDYIFTKYAGGMDAEFEADLQKYNK